MQRGSKPVNVGFVAQQSSPIVQYSIKYYTSNHRGEMLEQRLAIVTKRIKPRRRGIWLPPRVAEFKSPYPLQTETVLMEGSAAWNCRVQVRLLGFRPNILRQCNWQAQEVLILLVHVRIVVVDPMPSSSMAEQRTVNATVGFSNRPLAAMPYKDKEKRL